MSGPVLETRELRKHFPIAQGLAMRRVTGWLKAVDGVSLAIPSRATYALVGESGCGKSTLARLLLLLERPSGGTILFDSSDLLSLRGSELARYRRAVQAVFQDPYSSLSPRLKVRDIIAEPLTASNAHLSRAEVGERVSEVLHMVGLSAGSASLYPHEFSGGQRQRIAIARAIACRPRCIILDEPVSALDPSIRAQIVNLLKDLQDELGVSYLIIAHDLAVVKYLSQQIGVMYLGKIVELAEGEELYAHPLHPYTQALLSSVLPAHPDAQQQEIILRGEVPSQIDPPSGCRFHPRCFHARAACPEQEPVLKDLGSSHLVACNLY